MKRYRLVVMGVAGMLFVGTAAGISSLPRQQVGGAPWAPLPNEEYRCPTDDRRPCGLTLTATSIVLDVPGYHQVAVPLCAIDRVTVGEVGNRRDVLLRMTGSEANDDLALTEGMDLDVDLNELARRVQAFRDQADCDRAPL